MVLESEITRLVSEGGVLLGEGVFGWAFRVRYQGRTPWSRWPRTGSTPSSSGRRCTLVQLDGLGGAPRVATVCEDYPGFIMDYCGGGTLQSMLKDAAPVGAVLRAVHDLALRLEEIHRAGYAHNDLKVDNVMVETGADGRVRARLIDLGLCGRLGESPGLEGDPKVHRHVAPELLRRGVSSVESETYSLGYVLRDVLRAYAGSLPRESELRCLARAMTCPDPLRRPAYQLCLAGLADSLEAPRRE
nr:hormonally up-regulated neu tumor-associated kinase homolog B-like [Penaeus vannamei]